MIKKKCGLLGYPIFHSLSPSIHNQWFKKYKICAEYELYEYQDLSDADSFFQFFLDDSSSLGLNITVPYKQWIARFKDIDADNNVKILGAANTLYRANKKWCLANTDIYGLKKSIDFVHKSRDIKNFTTIILGAGGAAKAAVMAALEMNSDKVIVLARDTQKASHDFLNLQNCFLGNVLVENFHFLNTWKSPLESSVLLINTIPLGLGAQKNIEAFRALDLLTEKVFAQRYFIDVIYQNTPATIKANQLGWRAINGNLMLTAQASQSFFYWTGVLPEIIF